MEIFFVAVLLMEVLGCLDGWVVEAGKAGNGGLGGGSTSSGDGGGCGGGSEIVGVVHAYIFPLLSFLSALYIYTIPFFPASLKISISLHAFLPSFLPPTPALSFPEDIYALKVSTGKGHA